MNGVNHVHVYVCMRMYMYNNLGWSGGGGGCRVELARGGEVGGLHRYRN